MFCLKCGEKLQTGADFCGNCGSAASSLSRAAPVPEPQEEKAALWLRLLIILWPFVYSSVGASIFLFLLGWFLGLDSDSWLMDNLIAICIVIGAFNVLTRGVYAAFAHDR